MISILITILVFVFTISLLVFIHEGGHFLVAKWARVWVHEFAIGFGPAVWRRKWGETQYALRVFPLGGFVRLAGEDARSEEDQQVPQDRLFVAKPPLLRMAIIFAGPLMNIIAAVFLMIAYVSFFGMPAVEIAEVAVESPARGVLQAGDKLLQLNGQQIYSPEQIQSLVQASQGRPIVAVVDRGGRIVKTMVTPYWDAAREQYLLGVYFLFPLSQIAEIPSNSELARQGLQNGDLILTVGGRPVGSWPEFLEAFNSALKKSASIPLRISRAGTSLELTIDSAKVPPEELQRVRPRFEPLPPTASVIHRLEPDAFLASQGLRPGDRLLTLNGEEISSLANLWPALLRAQAGSGQVQLIVERGKEILPVTFNMSGQSAEEVLKGLQLQTAQRRPASVWASISIGLKQVANVLLITYQGVKQVLTGQTSAGEAFRGPVGIANILGWSLTQGAEYFFRLVALLSLVLGVFNLLPFPALDGSRLVFAMVELILRRPIPPQWEGWVHYVGFIILMGLIVLITWQDIQRLFRGEL